MKIFVLLLTLFTVACSTQSIEKPPKNIILFIGDGMGPAQLTVLTTVKEDAAILRFKKSGMLLTHAFDNYITDSAAGATAYATGVKTIRGAVGVGPDSQRVKTVLEFSKDNGMAVGLVVTSGITNATPAGFIAHVNDRNKHLEIAKQMAESDVDVLIGGGRELFIPKGKERSKREDELDLEEILAKKLNYITNSQDFKEASEGKSLAYLYDYGSPGPVSKRPHSLKEMTEAAIKVLGKNDKGFFLMVEGSQIDWFGHDNDLDGIVEEIKDFDGAVAAGLDFADQDKQTLVIVTADHETGGLALTGGSRENKTVQGEFTWENHTAVMVPIFSYGPRAEDFGGINENTIVGKKLIEYVNSK